MDKWLPTAIFWAGIGQWTILVASSLVPSRLNWKRELAGLTRLHRQMYYIYGGYIVLAIIAFGLISTLNAHELAGGSRLARAVAAYIAVFWGIRLGLQWILDVKEHLSAWWLRAGYYALTVLFAGFTAIFGIAALH